MESRMMEPFPNEAMTPYGAAPGEAYGRPGPEAMDSYGPSPIEQYGRGPGDWQDYGPDSGSPSGYMQEPGASGGPVAYQRYGGTSPGYMQEPSPGGQSYQRYTEKSSPGPVHGIDPETGIAPRRLTDCVCTVLFVLYVLAMIVLVLVVKSRTVNGYRYSDVRRLTRGMDYAARLCGVDEGVEDKPYTYWCRSNPAEWWAPSALDLWNPSCVSECPNVNGSHASVPCLYPEQKFYCSNLPGAKCHIPGGQFGNVVNFHVQSQQSIVMTNPYNTRPVGGRYCMPVDKGLRQTILRGPLNGSVRALGSFESCWGVLFFVTVLAVGMSYFYVLMLNECGKVLVYGFLAGCLAMFGIGGVFLLATLLPGGQELNPLFRTQEEITAYVVTVVSGIVLLMLCGAISGTITHVAAHWGSMRELVRASAECLLAMRSMLIPPAVEALWKFVLAWILMYNFLHLVSVGWVDDHRTSIDGQKFKGLNARFYFDWALTPWILMYMYGAVWIMELCNAFGQFLVAFSVISWYFMKKEGSAKTGVPPLPPLHGTLDGLVYHFGSLCLGAAVVPWVRPIRVFNWVLDEAFPSADAECCGPLEFCTPICKTVGKTFGACEESCRKHFTPQWASKKGLAYKYTKNVYSDIIIRSQHFLPASERSAIIINTHKSCQRYMMSLTVVTTIGVLAIGSLSAVLTYFIILTTPSLSDPSSPSYVVSPLAVAAFACWLAGDVAYGFMGLFDHTADTLLYCYAWNKKFNKETVDQFMPESIRDLVGHIYEQEDGYQYFGNARPEMYLSSWLPKKFKEKGKKNQVLPNQPAQQVSLPPDAAFSGAPEDPAGQYVNMGFAHPDSPEAEGGYYYGEGPMYSGGGYDNTGRYVGAG